MCHHISIGPSELFAFTDATLRLIDVGIGRSCNNTVMHIEGSGLSRYDTVWLDVWFPAFLLNAKSLRYKLHPEIYARVHAI